MRSGRTPAAPTSRQSCLICRNVVEWEGVGEDLLEQQLRVIYVVLKLLEIPQHFTTRLLAEYGNPGEWTTFCAQCHTLVTQGEEIFKEIQQLEKKHQKLRDIVKLAMQVKPEPTDFDSTVELGGPATEIREFLEILDAVTAEENQDLIITPAQLSPSSAECSLDSHPVVGASPILSDTAAAPSPTTRRSQSFRFSNPCNVQHYKEEDVAYSPPATSEDANHPSEFDSDQEVRPSSSSPIKKPPKTSKDQKQFKCDRTLCKTECWTASELNRHIKRVHFHKENPHAQHPCDVCGKVFPTKGYLNEHKNRHNKNKFMRPRGSTPRRVNKILTFQEVLQVHKDFIEKLLPPRKTASKEDLAKRKLEINKHNMSELIKRNKIKEFPCQTCPQVFSMYQDWTNHTQFEGCSQNPEQDVVVTNEIKCEDCGNLLASRWSLENHFRLCHSPKDAHICRGCNQNFPEYWKYQAHYYKSNPDSDCVKFGLKCSELGCHKAVRNSEEALELHKKIHHLNPPPDPCRCVPCEKTFASKPLLRQHILRKHTPKDQRQFKCDRPGCATRCIFDSELRQHIKDVHLSKEEGAPTYPCEECGKVFTIRSHLARHKKELHNPDNPTYLCTICGKTFKTLKYLKLHSGTHDPVKQKQIKDYRKMKEKVEQLVNY